MTEYLIQGKTLTNLGDSIRSLNDTTDSMTPSEMKATIDEAVAEINTQTDLIAQCLSALEGKVGGSGGGSAIETCTVDLASAYDWELEELWYSNGNEVVNYFPENVYDRMSLTVVKNTILYMKFSSFSVKSDVTILGDAESIKDTTMVSELLLSINGDCSIDPVSDAGPM